MAAEKSCLMGVDDVDQDPDPDINALTLLQEPVNTAQESASCTFSTSSLKPSSVLDVLTNTGMLSSVGLGNGPLSQQATQAHVLNTTALEKEEEKSITPLKTVQDIDTAGIWGFDTESPENSLDNFDNASDLHWDPQKEFMNFLWENPGNSPEEESKDECPLPSVQRRRKRKMDMVVMVDPSEDLYPDLSHNSSDELSDAEGQADAIPIRKVKKSIEYSKSPSSPPGKVLQRPNGATKAIKQVLYNSPANNSHDDSNSHPLSPVKTKLTLNSYLEEKPLRYPCSKCKLVFRKEHHLRRHMKSHVSHTNMSPKPFVCRECGQSFVQSTLLIQHMAVHKEKRARIGGKLKDRNDVMKKDAKAKLFCPQCPFSTNCPNTFVQHAKTHQKDKRKFKCDKCSFVTFCQNDLRKHNIMEHTLIPVRKPSLNDNTEIYTCNICSYRVFSKIVFRKHLMRRHQQTYEEYEAAQQWEKNAQPSEETPTEDAELTSKISIKNPISSDRSYAPTESNDISDLFKNSKIQRGFKSQLTGSKLDKSINVLLSRQRHKKAAEQNESKNCSTSGTDQLPGTLSTTVKDDALSPTGPNFPSVSSAHSYSESETNLAKTDRNSSSVPKVNTDQSIVKKSPSKRKMSTPYHNTSDQDACFVLPKPLPNQRRLNEQEEEDDDDNSTIQFKETTNLLDKDTKQEKQNIIYTYSRRMSIRGALQASKRLFEKIKMEENAPDDPVIKEECIETEVFQETLETNPIPLRESFTEDLLTVESDHKSCPYCPAVFESGVGLSNHVRGHLHRIGLSYNARHIVPPEQVACQDRRPRIRRRMSAIRRLRKALHMESETEAVKGVHSCPLCGDSFDNRTGQSNHIRGHLKRLGKTSSTKTKSPLCLLRELMRDKKEVQRALQILGKKRNHFQYGPSPKLSSADCLSSLPAEIHNNNDVPNMCGDARPLVATFSFAEIESEQKELDTLEVKSPLAGTSALIGILKKRKCQEDAKQKGSPQSASTVSSDNEQSTGSRVASSLPNTVSEKDGFNRKVCIHCNATFHSGVSLSNHLRAYAKRKKAALLEGTTYDCKVRRQRSRPGSKKKSLQLSQTPEEMYRLTCRFCDLVFQGPLSVQEDWIKHLQRHISNTSVPHTGLSMIEIAAPSQGPLTDESHEDGALAAS